jgi:MFS family permease
MPERGNAMGVFASRWWIVAACACGLLVGAGAILIFTFGVFLKPVSEDLGIGRGDLSGGLAISAWFVALSCPIVGWLIDRFGTRRVMVPGILLFALAVASFGLMQPKLFLIYAIFCIAGLISGVQTPIPYAAVITRWFDSHRGIALGLATAGVGLGVALIPQLAAFLIGHFGWRHAYFGLGLAVVLLAFIPVVIFVRDPPWVSASARAGTTSELPGMTAAAALKSRNFWLLSIAFFLGVLAINGTIVHIVALLTDRGYALQLATSALSVAGLAIIIGRIFCGWCLDRFWGTLRRGMFFRSSDGGNCAADQRTALSRAADRRRAVRRRHRRGDRPDGILHQPLFWFEGLWQDLWVDVHAVQHRNRSRAGPKRPRVRQVSFLFSDPQRL